MVLEALAAISLTGNIVQFVEFGCTLFRKTHEIYESGSSKPSEYTELDTIAKRLQEHSKRLILPDNSENSDSHGQDATSPDSVATLAVQCRRVAYELSVVISKLTCEGGSGKLGKYKSFQIALRSVWKKEQVESLRQRMESLRDQIMFHLISQTTNRQSTFIDALDRLSHQSIHIHADVVQRLDRFVERGDSVKDEIISSSELLHNDIKQRFSELCAIYQNAVKSREILTTLQFSSMRARHQSIEDAHRCTFDWIFKANGLEQSDPRSHVRFVEWLQSGDGIFWIAGKPGAGKSTLMKYLEDHPLVYSALQTWADGCPLYRSSFYFWNSGTDMQKSMQGLLQSLLYSILNTCPDMIPEVCHERWGARSGTLTSIEPWTVSELRECINRLQKTTTVSKSKIYLHVDGVDEFGGDYGDIVTALKNLAAFPQVKLCLSSRPFTRFELAFGTQSSQKLYLETFTGSDIAMFTRENLTKDLEGTDICISPQLIASLVDEIIKRAEGVFLWVRLVVRSLASGLMNGDPPSLLHARLNELPTDLDVFFSSILRSIEPIYHQHLAVILFVMLRSGHELKLIDCSFLDDFDSHAGLPLDVQPFTGTERRQRLRHTSRQLSARYKGLLQCSSSDVVHFLHRTLADFLQTPRVQSQLQSYLAPDFDPSKIIYHIFLAEAKFAHKTVHTSSFERVLDFVGSISNDSAKQIQNIEKDCSHTLDFDTLDNIENFFNVHAPASCDSMLHVAFHTDRIHYVKYRLQKKDYSRNINNMLRHVLFFPDFDYKTSTPSTLDLFARRMTRLTELKLDMVTALLDSGADPNAIYAMELLWVAYLQCTMSGYADFRVRTARLHTLCEPNLPPLLRLFHAHGADIASQAKLWLQLFKAFMRRNHDDETREHALISLRTLFDVGVSTSDRCGPKQITIFENILRISQKRFTETRIFRNAVLDLFFEHDADVNLVFQDSGGDVSLRLHDDGAVSWFQFLLEQLRTCASAPEDPSSDFELILRHGLDPNIKGIADAHADAGADTSSATESKQESPWESVLSLMLREHPKIDENKQIAWANTILAFIRYGANPRSEALHKLVEANGDGKGILGTMTDDIIGAIATETANCASREAANKIMDSTEAPTVGKSTSVEWWGWSGVNKLLCIKRWTWLCLAVFCSAVVLQILHKGHA